MKRNKISTRLLSLLLCVIMVLGLLPASALAAPAANNAETSAQDAGYHVTFRQNAASQTQVAVAPVDSKGQALSITSNVTIDGVVFNLEQSDGNAIYMDSLVSGYGLLAVTAGSKEYFFDHATWGPSGESIDTIDYAAVTANHAKGIYLHYTLEEEQEISVKMFSANANAGGAETELGTGRLISGTVDREKAQKALESGYKGGQAYAYVSAELRPKNGNVSQVDSIVFTSIQRVNDYYRVVSPDTSNGYDFFAASDWDVCLMFTPAYKVTITATNVRTNTTIDGEQIPMPDAGGQKTTTYVYQLPKNGTLTVEFILGQRANMKVTNTTDNSNQVLFDSFRVQDGFQTKLWTLEMAGTNYQKDQTITVDITRADTGFNADKNTGAGTGYRLEYSDFRNNNSETQRWHASDIRVVSDVSNTSNSAGTSLKTGAVNTVKINEGQALRFFGGWEGDIRMFPDAIVLNGVSIPLNFNISWTKPSGITGNSSTTKRGTIQADFDVVTATVGTSQPRRMFEAEIWTHIVWNSLGGNIMIGSSYVEIRFTKLYNGISITSGNLAANNDYRTIILDEVGGGLKGDEFGERGLVPGANVNVAGGASPTVTPEFGYYVDSFKLTSGEKETLQPAVGTQWYEPHEYFFSGDGTAATHNKQAVTTRERGAITSGKIDFSLRYHMDKTAGSLYVDDSAATFQLTGATTTADGVTITQNSDTVPLKDIPVRGPDGSVFLGWSPVPNPGANAPRYNVGEVIPRSVIMQYKDQCVKYSTTTGRAYIHLYPVFVDASEYAFTTYAVVIHSGDTRQQYVFSGIPTGSLILRDTVLANETVASYVKGLGGNYVLDGGRSDSRVSATTNGATFNLYYYDSNSVQVTFQSEHGFVGQKEQTTITKDFTPGNVMKDVPTPYTGEDLSATFLGWSTISADDRVGAQQMPSLASSTAPYEATTYYAVYADNVTVKFYPFNGTTWESTPVTISLPWGQSIKEAGLSDTVNEAHPAIEGFTFDAWYEDGPYGVRRPGILTRTDIGTGTGENLGTSYYAVYNRTTNNTVVLDGNGGYFGKTAQKTLSGQTFGQVITPEAPDTAKTGGYVFVGWSTDKNAQIGSPSITVEAGKHTYYAIWMQTNLSVQASGDLTYNGKPQEPALTVTWNGKPVEGYQAAYPDGNTDAGLHSVTVTLDGKTGYATFEIKPKDITQAQGVTVTGADATVTYTGQPHRPEPTVTDSGIGKGQKLVMGKDYRVVYGTNTDVGSGTVTVIGMGNYTSQQQVTFRIDPVKGSDAIAVIPMPSFLYNDGKEPENFAYTVYDPANSRILLEKDYTVQGLPTDGQWTLGEHSFTVTGTGNYQGATATGTFSIVAAGGYLTVTATPAQAQVGGADPTVAVYLGDQKDNVSLEKSDYTLSYEMYDTGSSTWVPSSENSMKTVPGMYRISAAGKGEYQGISGSAVFVRTAVESSTDGLTASLGKDQSTAIVYDGADHSGILSGLTLTYSDGKDSEQKLSFTYTVQKDGKQIGSEQTGGEKPSGITMTDVGTYLITLTSKDQTYTGSTTLSVYITPRSITADEVKITGPEAADYTGGKQQPGSEDITVHDGLGTVNKDLTSEKDYTLSFGTGDYTKAGTYTITVSGAGNYTGTTTLTYTIKPIEITVSDTVELNFGYTDTSEEMGKIEENVKKNFVEGDTVTVHMYVDSGLPVGEHQHLHGTLSGADANNYRLNITGKVVVKAVDMEDEANKIAMQVSPASHSYNGKAHTPGVTVTANGTLLLQEGAHYTLTYYYMGENAPEPDADPTKTGKSVSEMKDVGYYIIRATAKDGGGYTGHVDGSFRITPADWDALLVTVNGDAASQTYTGAPITLDKDDLTVTTNGGTVTVTQYEITGYSMNQNVGTATVTVTANGVQGSANFQITAKDISEAADADKEIAVEQLPPENYNGAAHTPVPVITYTPTGGKKVTLQNGTDFHLTYQNHVQAGRATVVITGAGNYTGSRQVTFEITYAPVDLSFYTWTEKGGWELSETTVKATYGTAVGNEDTIKGLAPQQSGYTFAGWAENSPVASVISSQDLSQRDDIAAAASFYAVYDPVSNISVTLDGNGGSVDAFGGTAGGKTVVLDNQTYGTVLRPTATWAGYTFAGWSTSSGAVVGDMSITVPASGGTWYAVWVRPTLNVEVSYGAGGDSFIYNGKVQKPTITVTGSGGAQLSSGQFDVTWGDPSSTNAGTYGFTVTAKDTGARGFGTYVIAPKEISHGTVSVSGLSGAAYTGAVQQPVPAVSDREVTGGLQLNRDFTLAYQNNVNVGRATVTIGGIGNYTGSRQENFSITAYSGPLSIAPIPDQAYNNGSPIVPDSLVVYDSNGNVLDEQDYTAEYQKNTAIGTATVIVTGRGNYASTAKGQQNFNIVGGGGAAGGSGLTVAVSPEQAPVNGDNPAVTVKLGTVTLQEGQYSLTYEVYQPESKTWSAPAPLSSLEGDLAGAGMYRITASGAADYANAASGSAIFVRTPADSAAGGTGDIKYTGLNTGGADGLIYNGKDRLNEVLGGLSVTSGKGDALTAGTDYKVYVNDAELTRSDGAFAGAAMTGAGAYTIRIQGQGDYAESSASTTVYIQPKSIADSTVAVGGLDKADYDGAKHQPTVTVADSAIEGIAESKDYSVTFGPGDYTDAGSYLVTVTGAGNYTGSRTETFTIVPKAIKVGTDVTLTYGYTSVDLSGIESEIRKEIVGGDTVVINLYVPAGLSEGEHKDALKGYLAGIDAGNYVLSLTGKVTVGKTAITPPGGGGDADNRFEIYIYPSVGVYNSASHNNSVYVVVTHNGQLLEKDKDYTLSYAGDSISDGGQMINVGAYTITAAGTGSYSGSISGSYQIVNGSGGGTGGLEVSIADVSAGGTYTYTGQEIKPPVTVTYGDTELKADVDYRVQYRNNVGVGHAFIEVTGISENFAGMTGTAIFTIEAKSIEKGSTNQAADYITITGLQAEYPYTGGSIQPEVTVRDTQRGVDLKRNSEYTVEYGDNRSGQGTVTISGIGNYTGTVELTFAIRADDELFVSGVGSAYTYTGKAIEPSVTVKDGTGRVLVKDQDFTIRYENNLNVGTAAVIVEGAGEYSGQTVRQEFQITARLLHLDVAVTPQSASYGDGKVPQIGVTLNGVTLSEGEYDLSVQKYGEDGQLGTAEALTDPASQLAEQGMYVITASGKGDYAGAMGSATFVRLPDSSGDLTPEIPEPDPDDPGAGDVTIDSSNGIITMTFNGENRVGVLENVTITKQGQQGPEKVEITKIEISYNGRDKEDVTNDLTGYTMVNAGVYTVTYTAKEGTAYVTVVINPKNISDPTVGVNGLGADQYTYTAQAQTPTVKLNDTQYDKIAENTDYTVESVSKTDAGTYSVRITGTGNYTGHRYENFIINQAPITVTQKGEAPAYTYGYEGTVRLEEGTHYDVAGIFDGDDGQVTVTVTVPAGLYAGSYDLAPELSGDRAQNYTVSGTVSVIVNPISINPDPETPVPNPDKGDGDGDGVVDPDKDNDDDGYIEDADGDGTIVTTNGFTATMAPTEAPFTGAAHKPVVTVTYQPGEGEEKTVLKEGADYTVTYLGGDGQPTEMIQAGEYTVRVDGINNYEGGFDFTYTITKGSGGEGGDGDTDDDGYIEDGDGDHAITYGGFHVTMVPYSGYHNGQAHNPLVTVTFQPEDGERRTLTRGTDYSVAYYNSAGDPAAEMVEVGAYTVRITGLDAYDGYKFDLTYTIQQTPSGGGGGGGGGSVGYTITAQAGSGGVINPSGRVSVSRGANYTFTITAGKGYEISDVLVDGRSVGAVSSYTFEKVSANHTIAAEFAKGSEIADPDETGVSTWLNTVDHLAYMEGYPGSLFGPDDDMTRAQAAQLFYNLLLNQNVAVTVRFSDVSDNAWYAAAVNVLASMGVIEGVGGGRFDPERSITRAEFAAMATRFAHVQTAGVETFSDVSPSDWFYPYVATCVQYGWIEGYPDGRFGPGDNIGRAEVATLVNRMLGRSPDSEYVDAHAGQITRFVDLADAHWAYYQIMEATNAHDYTKSGGMESWEQLLK